MANQNQKAEEAKQEQVQQVEMPAPPAPVVQVVVAEQKKGILGWCKQHWKMLTGAILGTGAAAATTIVAYKKGKAAGINTVYQQQEPEDYSLNPNE